MKKAEIETERGKVKEERDKVQKEHMKMFVQYLFGFGKLTKLLSCHHVK